MNQILLYIIQDNKKKIIDNAIPLLQKGITIFFEAIVIKKWHEAPLTNKGYINNSEIAITDRTKWEYPSHQTILSKGANDIQHHTIWKTAMFDLEITKALIAESLGLKPISKNDDFVSYDFSKIFQYKEFGEYNALYT